MTGTDEEVFSVADCAEPDTSPASCFLDGAKDALTLGKIERNDDDDDDQDDQAEQKQKATADPATKFVAIGATLKQSLFHAVQSKVHAN